MIVWVKVSHIWTSNPAIRFRQQGKFNYAWPTLCSAERPTTNTGRHSGHYLFPMQQAVHFMTAYKLVYTYTCTKHSRVLINTRSHCPIRAPGPTLSLKPLTLPSLPHCNSHSLYLSSRSRACSHTPSFPLFTSGCTCTRGADLLPSACTARAGTPLRSSLQSQPRHAHLVLLLHPVLA